MGLLVRASELRLASSGSTRRAKARREAERPTLSHPPAWKENKEEEKEEKKKEVEPKTQER